MKVLLLGSKRCIGASGPSGGSEGVVCCEEMSLCSPFDVCEVQVGDGKMAQCGDCDLYSSPF